jgi:hypothetical protein
MYALARLILLVDLGVRADGVGEGKGMSEVGSGRFGKPPAVVFIAYHETRSAEMNMNFFIDYSFRAGIVGVEYDIVVAEGLAKTNSSRSRYAPDLTEHFRWFTFRNFGLDFCLWKQAMQEVALSSYKYFVFMNGSIRGPFVSCDKSKTWLNDFTSLLSPTGHTHQGSLSQKTPPAHLVGTSFNCHIAKLTDCADVTCVKEAHLQSMFLVIDDVGIALANETWGCIADKLLVIDTYEVGTTRKFLAAGWNVAAIQEYWRGHNFLDEESTYQRCLPVFRGAMRHWKKDGRVVTDPYYPGNEWTENGLRDVPPTEMIMFKANRQVGLNVLSRLTQEGERCNGGKVTIPTYFDPLEPLRSPIALADMLTRSLCAATFAVLLWRSRRSIWRCFRSHGLARHRQM